MAIIEKYEEKDSYQVKVGVSLCSLTWQKKIFFISRRLSQTTNLST